MRSLWTAAIVWCFAACTMEPARSDAGTDAPRDDAGTDTAPASDAPDTSAAAICPAYDAHARECFGETTGEDFLAECLAIYDGCSGAYPAVVRCRLETPCADLGVCAGLGC